VITFYEVAFEKNLDCGIKPTNRLAATRNFDSGVLPISTPVLPVVSGNLRIRPYEHLYRDLIWIKKRNEFQERFSIRR
jgi:hypothetical protein